MRAQHWLAGLITVLGTSAVVAQTGFVNFETPHVSPLAMTPDGTKLLAVNTADGYLEVFALGSGLPQRAGGVPVGVDPVSVRARSNSEAWVVNHVSDSVSVVDLSTMSVVRTVFTKDEPCDVVFAGTPVRAFVSCSQANVVQVFDPANPGAPVAEVPILGEDPRMLAVSPDGQTVYAAIFESGNNSTVLGGGAAVSSTIGFPPNVVSLASGPYGGVNPPPNSGTGFMPPRNAAAGTPPAVSLIVRKDGSGQWMDDNSHNWTAWVSGANASASGRVPGWTLADDDVAVISTGTLGVAYAHGLMNICMALGVNPATGAVTVVGTDGSNERRFEPNLTGRFLRVNLGTVDPVTLAGTVTDLNPHLTYTTGTIPQVDRDRGLGDPRGIVWNSAGTRGYVTGMGSNNVVVIDGSGARVGLWPNLQVGKGPTGIVLDEARARLYVLNKFDATITVLRTGNETLETTLDLHDATPAAVRNGRRYLYETHFGSGLGHIACASCHVDARMDRLAWDLGDPSGSSAALTGLNLGFGFNINGVVGLTPATAPIAFQPHHPMKGPMTTQTLQDIIGHEPHHWRGDRAGLEAFAGAFQSLQGDDAPMPAFDMGLFEAFLATIYFPPNPYRNLDNTLPTNLALPGHFKTGRFGAGTAGQPLPNGNAQNGVNLYRVRRLDGSNLLSCVTCHTVPTGAGTDTSWNGSQYVALAAGPNGEHHRGLVSIDGLTNVSMKVPQLRNIYEKTGFNTMLAVNTAGFGVLHDGSVDSIERFVSEPAFSVANDQEVADLVALMMSFSGSDFAPAALNNLFDPPGGTSQDAHAGVGQQVTFGAGAVDSGRFSTLLAQATANRLGLVVKGRVGGVARGYYLVGSNLLQSDRAGEQINENLLRALAGPGQELTYTFVAKGTERRVGVDRDGDTYLDRDELDLGSDPADPLSVPMFCDSIDFNNDGLFPDTLDIDDFLRVFAGGACSTGACGDIDFNNDGLFPDTLDIDALLSVFSGGPCL
ncbi:MAG: hypothetical protein U0637_01275 [Phycisphaerales bacterium]